MCGCQTKYKGLRTGMAVYGQTDLQINIDGYFSFEIENVGESDVIYQSHKTLSTGDVMSNCNQGGLPYCGSADITWPENTLSKKIVVHFTIPIPCTCT